MYNCISNANTNTFSNYLNKNTNTFHFKSSNWKASWYSQVLIIVLGNTFIVRYLGRSSRQ